MVFKHSVKGFSRYVFKKGGYVIRISIVTKHMHYKQPRFVSYRKDGRIILYSDKGKKETLSKQAIEKRGFVLIETPIEIPMFCDLETVPF
jgi:hypothetical protein